MTPGKGYCLHKEANLIKQKYMTQGTVVQNIKTQLKSIIENEKVEELKRKPMLDNSTVTLKDHQ
jgi:acetolactate synthase small subunit